PLRQRHCDGIWNITVFPIRVEGEIRYAGGLAREGTPWNSAEWELRRIVLSALKAQESERFRTARFLHDTIGQDLTALGFQLDLVRLDLERLSPETCARVSEVQRLLEGVMEDVRKFSYELKPSTVERVGLRPALNELIARLRTRVSGALRVSMEASRKQDPKIASAMYQMAQAALENAVQH